MKHNRFKKFTGILTNNFGLKLLAVIVACGLWIVVNNITDPMKTKQFVNVPVEIINDELITNEGKVYEVLDGTNYVNVTISGKNSVLTNITRDDIKAVADMSELTFMNTASIEVSSTRNNSDLEFKTNIENVKFSIEDIKRVQMIINVATTGEPAEGYVVGSVTSSQNIVRLSGPESLISQIDHVEATASIDGYSSDINTSVELKLYDTKGNEVKNSSVKMNISTVTISVTILATKEVPLVFTAADEPASGYVAGGDIVSDPSTVIIAGRKSVLDSVSRISVSDPALSLADRTEDVSEVINIKKYLPSGTQFADSSFDGNVTVTVGIEPLVTKDLRVPKRNFAAGNKPEGFDVTFGELVSDNSSYAIRISGTQANVDAVSAEEVIGVVDMNALLEELGMEEWTAGSYVGTITFNLPDNVMLAENYKLTLVVEEIADGNDEE